MVEITNQILASTNLDSHGEKLTREQLYALYESQPDELVINHEHDFGRPPIAVARNISFQELSSGEFAITADIEVHDEETFRTSGGFSIAWLADGYTLYPEASPELEFYFNPRAISLDDAFELMAVSTPDTVFNVRELKQKGLVTATILIVKFITASALAGFFGKFGSDTYDKLKEKLLGQARRKEEGNDALVLHLIVPAELNPLKAEVILEVPAIYSEHVRLGSLSFESAVTIAQKLPYAEGIQKVVIKTTGNPPQWILSHYIKSNGMPVRI